MENFIETIRQKAGTLQKRIVFPETFDERTLKAIEIIQKEKLARPLLIGDKGKIQEQASQLQLQIDWGSIDIVDSKNQTFIEKYSEELYKLRKEKGLTRDGAQKLLQDLNYFGVMMVHMNDADGMVSGANGTTAETIRPALQILKTQEKFHKVSGVFFMIFQDRLLLFADCAVNIEPNSHDLADIAIDTAETAKRFGIEPKIALLSFSTNGSAKHPVLDKIREAVAIGRDRNPQILIEGEMQVDAALVPEVCQRKFPESKIAGQANILIFPNLEAANIAYKLVERLAKAKAIGPILQGLAKPVNDLSRGCSVEDIVNVTAFTACEAEKIS